MQGRSNENRSQAHLLEHPDRPGMETRHVAVSNRIVGRLGHEVLASFAPTAFLTLAQ